MELNDLIKSRHVFIHKGRFAYLRAKQAAIFNHFLVAQDKEEVTIITEEQFVETTPHEELVKWFRKIEIKPMIKQSAPGFMHVITSLLREQDIDILIHSTFTKDYIFVPEADTEKAVNAFMERGFPVTRGDLLY